MRDASTASRRSWLDRISIRYRMAATTMASLESCPQSRSREPCTKQVSNWITRWKWLSGATRKAARRAAVHGPAQSGNANSTYPALETKNSVKACPISVATLSALRITHGARVMWPVTSNYISNKAPSSTVTISTSVSSRASWVSNAGTSR